MENKAKYPALPIRTDMLQHRVDIGSQAIETFGDLAQTLFDTVQTGLDSVTIADGGFVQLRRDPVVQNGVEVLRVPAEGGRQRLQCAPTSAALDGVMLNLANDRLRNVRPFRESR